MAGKMIGIEVGSDTVKMVLLSNGQVKQMAIQQLPENLVREGWVTSPDAMANFLKEMRKHYHIPGGNAALVLSPRTVLAHRVSMPMMSQQQLELNLPFEFRDFVGQDGAKYHYDYAVMDTKKTDDGQSDQLELFAAAARKELLESWHTIFRKAGLTLKIAVPAEMAWLNLVRQAKNAPKELCILDIGYSSTFVYIYADGKFMMGKEIEMGGQLLDETIAAELQIDPRTARTYKENNMNGVLGLDCCVNAYNALAVEVLKALNFYGYENRENNLQDIYYCGGTAILEPLRMAVLKNTHMVLHHIDRLIPDSEEEMEPVTLRCALAAAAASQR